MEGPAQSRVDDRFLTRWTLILLVGCAWLAVPGLAAPGGSSGEAAIERFADDARLGQKITITAWAEPLEDLLAGLSRQTGVRLEFDGRDVGDQRVNLLL